MKYPSVPSAIKPLPHGPGIPISNLPRDFSKFDSALSTDNDESANDLWDQPACDEPNYNQPKLLTQAQLNDLSRDLYLSKESAQLLGSRLSKNNLLAPQTTFYWYRNRDDEFKKYFARNEQHWLVYCNDVSGLVKALDMEYKAVEWRLFLDSSLRSMKVVLLHIGNKAASAPIADSVVFKESYLDMKYLPDVLGYHLHQWRICGDLKMISILLGLQGGYTTYPCFLCLWDSRTDDRHYLQKEWPARGNLRPGRCNVKSCSLVDSKNFLFPPLHKKLDLMKSFVKALNKGNPLFKFLQSKFPAVSDAKLGAGVYNEPQIRELMRDTTFDEVLTEEEKRAWESFKNVFTKFIGKKRSPKYEDMV